MGNVVENDEVGWFVNFFESNESDLSDLVEKIECWWLMWDMLDDFFESMNLVV